MRITSAVILLAVSATEAAHREGRVLADAAAEAERHPTLQAGFDRGLVRLLRTPVLQLRRAM